jgi:hypothetical protein
METGDDKIMNQSDLLALFDRQLRHDLEYPDMEKEVTSYVVRFIRPMPGRSIVLHSNIDDHNAGKVIENEIEYFAGRGLDWNWKFYLHDRPSDLPERLVKRGFEPDEPGAIMVLDTMEAQPELLRQPSASIHPIKDAARLKEVIQVMEQVYGGNFSWITTRLGAHLQIPGYLSIYVAEIDDQPGCAGWVYFPPNCDFATLWGGSTIPGMRHRGLYQAVLAARVQEAVRRGRRFLCLDASPMSQPIVARRGFKHLTTTQSFGWGHSNQM